MKHKVVITKVWETLDGADPEKPVLLTGVGISIPMKDEEHRMFIPGHNLKKNKIQKAIMNYLKTLPKRAELEGINLDIDTGEEE